MAIVFGLENPTFFGHNVPMGVGGSPAFSPTFPIFLVASFREGVKEHRFFRTDQVHLGHQKSPFANNDLVLKNVFITTPLTNMLKTNCYMYFWHILVIALHYVAMKQLPNMRILGPII